MYANERSLEPRIGLTYWAFAFVHGFRYEASKKWFGYRLTLVFEWEKDDLEKGTHIPLGHEACGKKKELVIAEEGKTWGRSTS